MHRDEMTTSTATTYRLEGAVTGLMSALGRESDMTPPP
jgi:hypothetical protein